MKKNGKAQLSASLISSNLSNIERTIQELKKGKVDAIHFDVMDGLFVPRFGLHPEILKIIRPLIKVPINIHMMIENVEPYLDIFAKNGADIITFHIESTNHASRIIDLIHKRKMKAGVALNPATPLNVLDYIGDDIELIMVMAINPGIVGHKLIPSTYKKLSDLNEKIKNKQITIEVDGGVDFETAPKMVELGADILVCGSHSIFKDKNVSKNITLLRKTIDK